VVNRIRTVFAQALADPGVKERLTTQGTAVMGLTPAQFAKFVDSEIVVSARLFQAAGIKPQ
jgi:tripartite-type tricarboxylate transporter receptor subunit TctC